MNSALPKAKNLINWVTDETLITSVLTVSTWQLAITPLLFCTTTHHYFAVEQLWHRVLQLLHPQTETTKAWMTDFQVWLTACWVLSEHTHNNIKTQKSGTLYKKKEKNKIKRKLWKSKFTKGKAAETLTHSLFKKKEARQRKSEWVGIACFHLNVRALTMKSCSNKSEKTHK